MCRYGGDHTLVPVDTHAIKSVVTMVPFEEKPKAGGQRCHDGLFLSSSALLEEPLLPVGVVTKSATTTLKTLTTRELSS